MPKKESRISTIHVPDERVDLLSDLYRPQKTIYAQVEYLLPGLTHASERKMDQGIWHRVRECNALIHVIRNFKEFGGAEPSPRKDFLKLDQELIISDLVVVEKRMERLELDHKRGKKYNPEEFFLLQACQQHLENETALRKFPEIADAPLLRGYALLSAKPVLVLFNNEDDDDALPDVGALIENETCMLIKGKLEQEIGQMSSEEARDYLAEFNIRASAMDRVIHRSYELLGLISFFTIGNDEIRAWAIPRDTNAVDAAEVIHTDLKKGFIRAEVVAYKDLMDAGSYAEARRRGLVRLEGKTYKVQDGDIIEIRFNL
jgi:ribosome-binding ATPase YchF (GTP1/OBG family)